MEFFLGQETRLKHRCDKRLQRLQQKKIFVNAFIILLTFITTKIT